MKKSKRILAILTIAAMALCVAPAPVFAATGDITVLTVATAPIFGQLVNAGVASNVSELGAPADYTVNVPLSPAQQLLEAASLVTITESAAGDAKVAYYPRGTSEGTTVTAVITTDAQDLAAELPAGTHFAPGDVLWINDGTAQVIRVVFITASTGVIDGEGSLEDVAFQIAVPLVVDFALDPGELNIEGNQIFGADYAVYNRTPGYAVNVEFSVTNKAGSGIAILDSNGTLSGTAKQAKMNIVNAASLTVTGDTVATVLYDSAATGAEAKRLDLARRTVGLSATAASNSGTPVITNHVLAPYSGALAPANVSAFTFRGNLNTDASTAYASNDVDVEAAYTLSGVGTAKYTREAPIRVGAGAKPFEVDGYGFVTTTNVAAGGIQNTMWLNPDNGFGYAGHTTLAFTAAQVAAGSVYIGMNLPAGTTVDGIWFGEVGAATSEFSNQTALFDLTGTTPATAIQLLPGWNAAATNRTFEFYIALSNGETWAVTVNANAS
jgi:hypothetical protein